MMQSGFSGQAQAGEDEEKYYKHVQKQKGNATTTTGGKQKRGTNYFASLACKHACLFVCKLQRKKTTKDFNHYPLLNG